MKLFGAAPIAALAVMVACSSSPSNPQSADGGDHLIDASHLVDARPSTDAAPADAGPPEAKITFSENPALPFPTLYIINGGTQSSQTLQIFNTGTAMANGIMFSIAGAGAFRA